MTYSGRKGGGGKRNNNYGYRNRGSYYGNNNQHENSNSRNHGNNNSNNNSNNHRNNWGQSNNWNQARSTPFHQNRSAHGIRNHHEDVNDNPQYMRPGDRNNNPPTNGNNENSQIDNTRSQNDNRDSRNQGRNQESSRRVKGVNKDTWDQFSLQDRIQSQYQGNFNDYYHKDQIFEDSDEWAEKKELAAEYAVEKLMTEMIEDAAKTQNTNQDIYESDSEDSYMQDTVPITAGGAATANTANLAYPRSTIEKFIDSLRFNLIFNVGFDVKGIHPDDEVSCFCPCSKTMSDWRDNFKVNHMESKDKCNYYRRAEPKGLMDHLRKTGEQGGFLHRGIELYVTKLYEGYWGRDIGHKALYNKGDDMHKKAEAEERRWKMIEYMSIKRDLDETRKKIKEQEEELKKEKEAVHNLKAVNQKLGEKYTAQKKNFEVLDIEMNPHTDAPTQQQIDKWCRVSRTHFESLKKIIKFRDPNVETRFEREMIVIKLPHHFILQNFFDKVHKESAPKQSTFLFRDLTYQTKKFAPEGYFSYKLFLDWNVIFDAPIKSKRGHRIKMEDEDDKIQGKDEGGPTSQFISMFCMQLCDLSVMLPFDSDVKNTNIDISREELKQETDFINPEKGSKVLYKGKYATVINHSTDYCNADLEIDADGEQIFNVERRAFIVEKIPIKLFEQTSGGIVPERDDIFDNALIKYRSQKFDPKLDQAQLEARGRKYYRAVGRFLLHVMADGRNPIPTTVMPEFYRNVLLRGCMPGSDEYADADFYTHLAQIEGFKDVRVFFNQEFELYGIEKEGIITKENFKTDFAPAYIVDARSKNLEALREGLTLNGEFPLDILSCQPLEAINQTFFSKPTFSVQDIIVLLKPCYENEILDEVSRDNHELFMKQTLPQALEALEKIEKESKKDSSFLADFLFFATGTRCVPYCNGMPDFNLSILFAHIPDDSLPATHTCENLIHIPWGVYDNNAEIFMTKLQTAVKYALVAGFDRM